MGFLTYDELYGVNISEYCLAHNTTLEEIISKSEIDIEILKDNLRRLIEQDKSGNFPGVYNRITPVHSAIKKKQNHIDKLKDWQAGI